MNIQHLLKALSSILVLIIATVAPAQANGPYKITLAGGSVGGAWSAIGTAIGESIKTSYPGSAFTYEPGREAGNLVLTAANKVQLGIAHAQMALRAEQGLEPFNKPVTNIRAIAMIDPQATVQVLATQRSGITNLAQIKTEKLPIRISLNQRGTLMAIVGEAVLQAYGISTKDIESWGGRVTYGAFGTGLDQIKNGQSDIIINMLAFPSGQIQNAARDTQFNMIGLDSTVIQRLTHELGMQAISVAPGTYDFVAKPIETITGSVILAASTQMSDQEANDIVHAMLQNFKFLQTAHATLSRLTPRTLTETQPIALHPGALKAYRQAGLLP